jgi:hypothetical protein
LQTLAPRVARTAPAHQAARPPRSEGTVRRPADQRTRLPRGRRAEHCAARPPPAPAPAPGAAAAPHACAAPHTPTPPRCGSRARQSAAPFGSAAARHAPALHSPHATPPACVRRGRSQPLRRRGAPRSAGRGGGGSQGGGRRRAARVRRPASSGRMVATLATSPRPVASGPSGASRLRYSSTRGRPDRFAPPQCRTRLS